MNTHSVKWVYKWLGNNRLTVGDMRQSLHHYDGKARPHESDVINAMREYAAKMLKYISSSY